MAAEVQVSDVLCEAMEYLTKLGSNLRTRSESLKQKRICKAKLKNTHAVQKAANKVLLICELSKKSLDNVETGVRKVLSLIEASQSTSNIGGKNLDTKSKESRHKYQYFEYKSRKLRIAKKISLKHYTSAKVVAKGMSSSMLDKHPVYYDCKLKRLRRRLSEKQLSSEEIQTSIDFEKQDNEISNKDNEKGSNDNMNEEELEGSNDIQNEISCAENVPKKVTSQPDEHKCEEIPKDFDVRSSKSENEEKSNEVPSREHSDHDMLSNASEVQEGKAHSDKKTNNKNSCNKSKDHKSNQEILRKENLNFKSNKKRRRVRIADSSDSDVENVNKKEIQSDDANKNHTLNSDSEYEHKAKTLKLSVSNDAKTQIDSDCSLTEPKIQAKDTEIVENLAQQQGSDNDSNQQKSLECNKNESSEVSKPLIRCVNLSKLLKSDILTEKSTTDKPSKNKLSLNKNDKVSYEKCNKYYKEVDDIKESDDEYWIQKRKEVNQFKPKNFSIKIQRLPNLTISFLLANNLKKIVRKGNIICEVTHEKGTHISKKINEVKNALLYDSESDEGKETAKEKDLEERISDGDQSAISDNTETNTDQTMSKKTPLEVPRNIRKKTENLEQKDQYSPDDPDRIKLPNETCDKSEKPLLELKNSKQSHEKISDISDKLCLEKSSMDSSNTHNNVQPGKNDLSEEKSNMNRDKSITTNNKIKLSLLNDSPDEKSDRNEEASTLINEKIKSSLLNDSSDEKPNENEETPTKTNKDTSSLIDFTDEEFAGFNKSDQLTPTKIIEKVKNSLLNNSSDEKCSKSDNEPLINTNEKVKSALLNDSSHDNTDSSDNDNREKRKTPKSKRKYARTSREIKKKLNYSSSSDSEQEKVRNKPSRKKAHISSSSSSEEKNHKKRSQDSKSSSQNSDSNETKGADVQSKSSVDKMVRSKAKPSGSSSQNSDNQDTSDKDIDGLTNLNTLNKTRRREHSAKSREESKRSSRSKPTPIIGEDLLKAESSSDVSDDGANEFEQDLPPVTLPGLNGDGIDHLAKDDLLEESDSSGSHNEKGQSENTNNMDETDEEENLKLKRRKANAISSDSEGGSNRRKQQEDGRMSDFEDSEDDSSEPAKKAKRKKKASDSDASVDSSDAGKKKRRRIKQLNDSDVSGSDTENEGRNKHGRKNIRKVMGKNQLEEATKKAAREEKERIARIAERQKLYNNLDFDESGKPDEVVLEKVVLDFDPETKEPLIQVDRGLVKKLKPHQANGIKFMWDACFESVKRIKKDKGSGCILAHCMGLGKTLQVISLTHTLLTHGSLTGVNRVLVVCPLSTVLNWVNEFRMWLKHAEAEFEVDVYELSRYKQNSERAFQLQQWFDGGGVCVLGYEMFRNLSADNQKKFKKKMLRSFQESLVDPGPDLVVCDEGHLLKNEKTSLSQSMNRVKTRRRIVLTGTPLQNNLKEYYCMVQFVKPNLLGKYNEYLNRFVNPITNGQYTDSTEHDIRVMKRRSHVLHKMLDGAVQRRDYGVLAPFLPPKHEYVLFITLTDVQVKLYQFYLDNYSRRPLAGKSSGFLFPDFQSLQRIWTHPLVLKYNSERYEIMQQKKREREEEDSEGSLVDFIDDDSTPEETSTEESSDDLSDMSDDSRKKSKKKKSAKKGKGKETKASTRRGTRANPIEIDDEDHEADDVVEVKNENPTEWWIKLVEESELDDMRNSHKLVLLFDILRQCETIGDKLLVFSQSLYSLDLIEHFLGKVDEATQEGRIDEKLGGHVGSWSPGVDYFRLDGSTSCENRSIWCKNFNREDNPRARLFLISTRAGGLGINLVAANRVVIFDVSWNPSHDVQSIFRVYRFGQKKPCYIYRFLAMGTMEEKIYERQVTKQAISKRVIDEQQIDRHYAENDLAELYKFEARPDEPRPLPTLPKDRLFAEMLKEHEAQIYKYHEHDSLLENKEEETLSEEERKAAWEDFENEKNKPPPAPFPSAWPMHNGMVPGLLAQQQQQLTYAALAAMIRKDMPNISDTQIRAMVPLLYNSNPGLMQKLSEMYKYSQPGMMNPGMMNAMDAGSGGGGMGGTSGLQYEPPWLRQHKEQQQQQMRLQQLMQQQNQMGAKYYAGGLGSRDPVAMALQQQRAREIMMSGGSAPAAGRPRGRPPALPRLPTLPAATSHDVVNLDSD